jgi:hypothetical protein
MWAKEEPMKPSRIPTLGPEQLGPEQLGALEKLYSTTRKARLRTRAQMLLLAAEQLMTAAEIAQEIGDRPRQRGEGTALAQTLPPR